MKWEKSNEYFKKIIKIIHVVYSIFFKRKCLFDSNNTVVKTSLKRCLTLLVLS